MSVDSTLLAIAPELAAVDPTRRAAIISIVQGQVGENYRGRQELATAYLAAHMLTLGNRGGFAGAIQSEKEGDLARSYFKSDDNSVYGSTSYGSEYMRIKKTLFGFSAMTRTM